MSDARLVRISLPVFRALAAEDLLLAESLLGLPVHPEFAERTEIWDFMVSLLTARDDAADWAMNAVVVGDVIVGNAGFKGGPGTSGEVEIGYSTSPTFRRHGYAFAAVQQLLARTRQDPDVDRVIATIAPDNAPSVGLVTRAGFTPAGERVHPRFGRQLMFSLDVSAPAQ